MKVLFFIIAIWLFSSPVFASEVVVSAQGETELSAIHAAMRLAIEQELGVFIDSKTLIYNKQLIDSEVASHSQGFISSYKVLRKSVVNGIFEVEIKAFVQSDAIKAELLPKLQKASLIKTNLNDPRIAVVATDSAGLHYSQVENIIISSLQNHGFSRFVQPDFADLIVNVDVCLSFSNNIHRAVLNSRILTSNYIIYANSFTGQSRMFTNNSSQAALNSAANLAAIAISNAAFNLAASLENHITISLSRHVDNFSDLLHSIQGINNVFPRHISSASSEFDVDFDGTVFELANSLQRLGVPIIEVHANFIKI